MRASFSDRFYIAAPQGVAVKLSDMLSSAQIIPSGVVHTGDEAVRAAKDGALLLTTYRLPDMTGEELASRLGEAADVVMIVPQDYAGRAQADRPRQGQTDGYAASDRIRGALPHSESEHGFRQAHCRRCA
mgnify:CR=1 FL=1